MHLYSLCVFWVLEFHREHQLMPDTGLRKWHGCFLNCQEKTKVTMWKKNDFELLAMAAFLWRGVQGKLHPSTSDIRYQGAALSDIGSRCWPGQGKKHKVAIIQLLFLKMTCLIHTTRVSQDWSALFQFWEQNNNISGINVIGTCRNVCIITLINSCCSDCMPVPFDEEVVSIYNVKKKTLWDGENGCLYTTGLAFSLRMSLCEQMMTMILMNGFEPSWNSPGALLCWGGRGGADLPAHGWSSTLAVQLLKNDSDWNLLSQDPLIASLLFKTPA